MRICNLNVCGISSKAIIPDVKNYFKDFDIICLQETKTDDSSVVNIPGLKFTMNNRNALSIKRSGGIGTLVSKKYLNQKYIEFVPIRSKAVLWCLIKKSFTGLEKDILFGNVYVPPITSDYSDLSLFDDLEEEIIMLNSDNNKFICICGDLNAHFGILSDRLEFDPVVSGDMNVTECLEEIELPERSSEESVGINTYGRRFIDLCISCGLKVANGRCGEDKGVGKTTCKNVAVDDIVAMSPELFEIVNSFKIDDFDPLLSDCHCAINFSFSLSNSCSIPKKKQKRKEKVNKNLVKDLDQKLEFNLPSQDEVDSIFTNSEINSDDDRILVIENALNNISNILTKTVPNERPNSDEPTCQDPLRKSRIPYLLKQNKPWFDDNCRLKRLIYLKQKKLAKNMPNDNSKTDLKAASKAYSKEISRAKRVFENKCAKQLRSLKGKNPSLYWKILCGPKKDKIDAKNDFTMKVFTEHFKKLNESSDNCEPVSDLDESLENNNILNNPINEDEIIFAVKHLKNNKAAGLDSIKNESIKKSLSIMLPVYLKLFNLILDSGVVPSAWNYGLIKPIYKKDGNILDPDNYRGISILSNLGKVFTAILNNRIVKFLDDKSVIGYEQTGFRKGFSTSDNIFTLKCLLDIYFSKGKKLYVGFIDFKKAFDSVWRARLWQKLIGLNIGGKILRVIQNIYDNAKACVKIGSQNSEFFACSVGVRQGDNLSPILFAIYLNDLSPSLEKEGFDGVDLSSFFDESELLIEIEKKIKLFALLYADDTALISDSALGLQHGLNVLSDYCKVNKLNINYGKTKIVIFSPGKVKTCIPSFFINETKIKIVDEFTFLGIVFSYNGSFKKAQLHIYEQANKAMFSVLRNGNRLNLPLDLRLELFDSMVVPILLYGCEVWGFENFELIESLHLKYCKYIMKLSRYTPSVMVYGELGRYPLKVNIYTRMIKFWANIILGSKDKLTYNAYCVILNKHQAGGITEISGWLLKIKNILYQCGLNYVWDFQYATNKEFIASQVNDILKKQFIQEWNDKVSSDNRCSNYKLFKDTFCFEKYLIDIPSFLSTPISQFRCGNFKFPNVINRLYTWLEKDTKCPCGITGDEYHFLLECDLLKYTRQLYIPDNFLSNPNYIKFKNLLQSDNHMLCKVGGFLNELKNLFDNI